MDTMKLWLLLGCCTLLSLLIGLPSLLASLRRLAAEVRQELDAVSSGSAYDGMLDAQEEEPTQPLPMPPVEEAEYTALRTQAYARCLEILLTVPEEVRKGI